MNNLKRELAPISTAAWSEIDAEATRVLKLKLTGRKLVDFDGPLGPTAAAVNTGRREPLGSAPVADVEASRRQVLSLVELRSYFELSREEMDGVERGSEDPELQPLIEAATRSPMPRTPRSSTATRPVASRGSIRHPLIPSCRFPMTSRSILTQAVGDGGYPVLNEARVVARPRPHRDGIRTVHTSQAQEPRRLGDAARSGSSSTGPWCGHPRSTARWC